MFLGINISLVGRLKAGLSAYAVGAFEPDLVFDFANEYYRTGGSQTTFDSAMTLDRSSNATMVDSDGLLKWAPHNLLTYSEEFAGGWSPTASSVTFPGGSEVRETTTTSTHLAQLNGVLTPIGQLTAEVEVAGIDRDYIRMGALSGGTSVVFRLSTQSIHSAGASLSASVTDLGDGYYNCKMTWNQSSASTFFVGMADDSGNTSYTGDVTKGAFFRKKWAYRSDLGGMVNNPDRGDSYVPTTSAARYLARRGHHVYNGTSWVNEGVLVEPTAATNLFVESNDFTSGTGAWLLGDVTTTQNAIGPDGVINSATTLEASSATSNSQINEVVSVTTSTVYTLSCFAKAGTTDFFSFALAGFTTPAGVPRAYFNLSSGTLGTIDAGFDGGATIENIGNGWYRCSVSFTTDATDTNGQVYLVVSDADANSAASAGANVLIYGAQFEQGSTPSSYSPTSGSTVTRAADTLTVPSANLPWPTPNVIGPELVTNGTFDTDTDWTKETGWTISGGTANHDGTGAGSQIDQPSALISGRVYVVTFDLVVTSGSGVAFRATKSSGTGQVQFTTSGSKSLYFVSGDGGVTFAALASFVGTIDNISVREIDPLAVSIQMEGRATGDTLTTTRWYLGANNYITQEINTSDFTFEQANAGTVDAVTGGSFTSGVNTAFNFASTHASTLVAAAVGGTALVDNTTPTALADLSSTDMALAYSGGPMILKTVRMWPVNVTEAGREEASS